MDYKLINQFAAKYKLTDLEPVDNLTFGYVLSGIQGKTSIILKLGLDIEELKRRLSVCISNKSDKFAFCALRIFVKYDNI
ncbi:MAG: hypothetical protein EOP34_05945 [Rickettsiales bacterium]|nr:MAG: hypothetical protein EOP34_05945 [Rickettsiales bacterium]